MNIGEAAKATGLSAKMIRHYESIQLLPAAKRSLSGYRRYNETDIHTLAFIQKSRVLGFSLAEIKELVSLWQDRGRESREVKQLTQKHIVSLEAKVQELKAMIGTLQQLSSCCHGDERPECPILEGLAKK